MRMRTFSWKSLREREMCIRDRIQSIDIEHFITEFLMLRIEYASFAEDDAGRIGFLADGATPLLVHQDLSLIHIFTLIGRKNSFPLSFQ